MSWVEVKKNVFVNLDNVFYVSLRNTSDDIRSGYRISERNRNKFYWRFYAPVITDIEHGEDIEEMYIDSQLFNTPTEAREWLDKLLTDTERKRGRSGLDGDEREAG